MRLLGGALSVSLQRREVLSTLALMLALFSTLFYSCSPSMVEAEYLLSDGELACVSWVENDHLAVLLLPQEMVDGFAAFSQSDPAMTVVYLVGLPASSVRQASYDSLVSFGKLAVTLSATARGVPSSDVDAALCLEVLSEGARYLRKSFLADTLASITGQSDPFGMLETVKQATVFDLRTSLALSQNTDWELLRAHLKRYVEEIRRFQRKE